MSRHLNIYCKTYNNKKNKLLGILFRFVSLSIIANYFFSSFDTKENILYVCFISFTNNYFLFHYDCFSSPYKSILEKVLTEWQFGNKGGELALILFVFFALISVPIFTSKGVVFSKLINKKSNNNFTLLPSEKVIYFLKLVELKLLQYALCGEKQKETNKLGVKC